MSQARDGFTASSALLQVDLLGEVSYLTLIRFKTI